jgi:hypothetical protein
VKVLRKFSNIISQIWEHMDGTGFPNLIPGSKIKRESQIIEIANIYHNEVYGITANKYKELMNTGIVNQTKGESDIRHKEAIKYLFKKTSWFDRDVLQAFNELVAERECLALKPNKDTLYIDFRERFSLDVTEIITKINDQELDPELIMDTQINNNVSLIPTEIEPSEVKPGMIVVENITTVNGIAVVKAHTELNAELVKKIKQFDMQNTLRGKVVVLLPEDQI